QIYEYIGEDPLLPADPAVPVLRLDQAIYALTAIPKVSPPNPGDPDDPANYDFVPAWRLLEFGAHQSVNVSAENNATIDTLVGGAAGAVAGGMGAVAGSIGVAIGRNLIGTGSAGAQATNAYVENSEVIASGDVTVHADASETIEADVFAGSVAVAIGIGGAIAGAGAELHNLVSSDVQAYALDADLGAMGDIDVLATSSTDITRAEALGVAVSGGLVGFSVSVSVVENTIANDVDAYISSTGDAEEISAGGKLTVLADVGSARIVAAAETASVAVGAVAGSGGGIDIDNTVANTVNAALSGTLLVAIEGGVEVKADESTYLSAEALSVAAAFGFGAAVGAALVSNTADSDIDARISGADVETTLGNVDVLATSVVDINNTDTAGISGSFGAGVTTNAAHAIARNTVKAGIYDADVTAENGTVTVEANADNDANSSALGGAVGALAIGAMVSDVTLGTTADNEVLAEIGTGSVISSGGFALRAVSNDDLLAEAEALSGGLVGVAGAEVDTETRQDALARVGDNVVIRTGTLEILADNEEFVDSRGDALAFGLAAGTGVEVDNLILSRAVVDIGENSELYATDMFIDAKNIAVKERFALDFNLSSGSLGFGATISTMTSNTDFGNAGRRFDARVDIGAGTLLQVDAAEGDETPVIGAGSRELPRIEIEAFANAEGVDNVKIESVSGLVGGAKGQSVMNADLRSLVNVDGATIVNNDGDIFFTTRIETLLRPNANLTVASGLAGGALADVSTVTNARNEVTLDDATVRGNDVSLYAGEDSIRVPNTMFSFGDSQIFTASLLPSIGIPIVVAEIYENNVVNVRGNTVIEATSDINLYATEGIGGDDRAGTTGSMLSLSLVPYAVDVPDGAHVESFNDVNVEATAYLEAGINNLAPIYLLPVNTTSPTPGLELPADVNLADLDNGVLLTEAHKRLFGFVHDDGNALTSNDPVFDVDLEFRSIDMSQVGFFVDNGTVIEDSGFYYMLNPDFLVTDSSINVILQNEDFTDTARWIRITIAHDISSEPNPFVSTNEIILKSEDDGTVTALRYVGLSTQRYADVDHLFANANVWQFVGEVYSSDVTDSVATQLDGKFYVIKPVELPTPIVTYVNIGSLLVQQLEEVEAWILNHTGDPDAIARYNVQRDQILATMTELGLTELVDGVYLPARELDTVLFDLPDILSSAGSIYVNVDNDDDGTIEGEIHDLVQAARIVPNAGARIDIQNRTPISMSVNDAIIEDNRRIEAVGGSLVVFTPGNVYFNGGDLTSNDDSSAQDITIFQDALLDDEYDLGGFELPPVPQDLYISGDVINENGDVTITNREGSINVSGIIRGEQVEVVSARNFSLNTEGWYHTNQDPRQY
ncbi:MAG TPA: hypothetical protein VLI71_17570, partial [Gammaproteobacteria bacterium]|nr:hypothetical protein [Gammaproteobacteria bacterium]